MCKLRVCNVHENPRIEIEMHLVWMTTGLGRWQLEQKQDQFKAFITLFEHTVVRYLIIESWLFLL